MAPMLRNSCLAGLLALALAGCGGRQQLRLPESAGQPIAPANAPRAPKAAELLEPPSIARPDRVTEVLRRSEVREDDRFDLPPPG